MNKTIYYEVFIKRGGCDDPYLLGRFTNLKAARSLVEDLWAIENNPYASFDAWIMRHTTETVKSAVRADYPEDLKNWGV